MKATGKLNTGLLLKSFTKKYSTKKYSTKKYSTKKYSTKKYSTKKYSTKKYSTKKYSTKKYSTQKPVPAHVSVSTAHIGSKASSSASASAIFPRSRAGDRSSTRGKNEIAGRPMPQISRIRDQKAILPERTKAYHPLPEYEHKLKRPSELADLNEPIGWILQCCIWQREYDLSTRWEHMENAKMREGTRVFKGIARFIQSTEMEAQSEEHERFLEGDGGHSCFDPVFRNGFWAS